MAGYLVWESDTFQKKVYPNEYWKKYWSNKIVYLNGNIIEKKQYINEAEIEIKRLNYENILNKDVEAYKSDNNILKTLTDANNRLINKWEHVILLSKETIQHNDNELEIAKKELSKYQ
jgi:hypothetical protein